MGRVFAAESAELAHFQTVGVVFLVLHGVVVALFALSAGKCDFDSHFRILLLMAAGKCVLAL